MQTLFKHASNLLYLSNRNASSYAKLPIIKIDNATFYRKHPSPHTDEISNPRIFPNLTFSIESSTEQPENWAIIGASSSGKTTFLEILRGLHLCYPPTSRTFPYLSSDEIDKKDCHLRTPSRAIQYVGFGSERGGYSSQGLKGSYLSARYESRREETDFSLLDYLKGNTNLNALEAPVDQNATHETTGTIAKVIKDLKLEALVDMPVGNLSNGQTRRVMIAKALLKKPKILLLDEPFMGLDPPTLTTLSPLLKRLTLTSSPRLVLALRPQDPLPEWITHLVYLGPSLRVTFQGLKDVVLPKVKDLPSQARTESFDKSLFLPVYSVDQPGGSISSEDIGGSVFAQGDDKENMSPEQENVVSDFSTSKSTPSGEPLVEMEGVRVAYGEKQVLGNWKQDVDGHSKSGLWWTIRRGSRWGIFGPNGSGKTTILSLICSDHPQAYSLPIRLFGRSRLAQPGQPGISIFDIQARIGHSSPEVHAFFPRNITVRQALENAWADTFLGKPTLTYERDLAVDACLRCFRPELDPSFEDSKNQSSSSSSTSEYEGFAWDENDWADGVYFGDLTFSSQRIVLFLRAIIKKPDLVLLDEAFSGMDDAVRYKCMVFLEWGEIPWRRVSKCADKQPEAKDEKPRRGRPKRADKQPKAKDETRSSEAPKLSIHGLSRDQALICVSHVKEEVPGIVRDWLYLPEADAGQPARFGHLDSSLGEGTKQWNEIWGM